MTDGQIKKLTHPMWSGSVAILDGRSYDIRTGQVVQDRIVSEAISTMLEGNIYDLDDEKFKRATKEWPGVIKAAVTAKRARKVTDE